MLNNNVFIQDSDSEETINASTDNNNDNILHSKK